MGDLYFKINVKPSDIYERKGDDLYAKVDVSVFDLVLGAEVTVPHPE
jgi:curved DNA-binding protein